MTHTIHSVGETAITFSSDTPMAELIPYIAKWKKKAQVHTQKSICNYLNLFADRGIRANVPLEELPLDAYNNIKAWNNSTLGQVKKMLLHQTSSALTIPKMDLGPSRAFTVGSAVHEAILEPHLFDIREFVLRPSEEFIVLKMQESVMSNTELKNAIETGLTEKTVTWIDRETKQPCKARLDLDLASNCVLDIKTTAARTAEEFIKSFYTYQYDRQAAMYIDGSKAKSMVFVGVQKCKPFGLFWIEVKRYSKIHKAGQKKYRFLIKKALEAGYKL